MLQDIAPHTYHVEFTPAEPQPADLLLIYGPQGVLSAADALRLPRRADFPDIAVHFAFRLDDRSVFLAREPVEAPEGWRYVPSVTYRGAEPRETAFACAVGESLQRWYAANRFCGRCGALMTENPAERAMTCPVCHKNVYPRINPAVIVAVLVKEAFGGEGHYPFHPAAVGVVVAGISWPQDVFSYPIPGTQLPLFGSVNTTLVEGMNATLLDGGLPSASTMNLLTGNVSAAMGTSAALVVMACGLFLLVRGRIKLSVVIPFFIFVIGLPWFFPNLNELPTFSLPWEYIRQRFYLEKYVVLSGTALFTGLFLICEPVTMPDRRMSRIIYGAALGIMTYVFRVFSPYECAACCALLIVSSIPEWLDLISHRTERIRFMREEEQRLANSTKPE